MNPPDRAQLDGAMRQVLAELAVTSNGRIAAYNPTGGHASDPGDVTTGDANPPHLDYAVRYGEPFHTCTSDCYHRDPADDDHQRRQVLDQAREHLERLRGRDHHPRPAGETSDDTIRRMLTETEGWTPDEVERSRFRMSARLVRRNRIAGGRDADTGHVVDDQADEHDEDLADRAVELRSRGMSQRQIAFILGKDKRQITRYLEKAA